MFDKHSFQHLTLRIFETKDDYKNYQNSKIGIIYSPVNLAGLKEIIIDFDAESGYRKIDRRYFVGIECILCLGLINDGEIVAIANPCAHKLHRKCIEAWIGGATNASERIERQSHCISCNTHIIRYVYRNATTGALVE
jgi:nitrite reductase/ring-hydroxylating ferredoxin subunit